MVHYSVRKTSLMITEPYPVGVFDRNFGSICHFPKRATLSAHFIPLGLKILIFSEEIMQLMYRRLPSQMRAYMLINRQINVSD
jgi:hypothetical protein